MTDQNRQFFAILTAVGEAKQANAAALGTSWTFAQMAVGDANGTDPIPNRTQTKLINERRRAPLNQVKVDPANASVIIAEQIIPESVGGWWVRELALYDADGDMVAVANCAPTFKPLLVQGSGRTQVIRINLIVSSTSNIELKIDPSVVLATRDYVDTSIIEALAKLDFKHSVLVTTTANIVLSGIQTIDGELLTAGARVLVKDQAQAKDNGIYVVPAAGAWKRAQDADASVEVTPGLFVSIEKGTTNGDSVWQLVTDAPIVLGTTALAFEMVAGRTGITAGAYTNVTVDKYGRVIAGTNPNTLVGHGITDAFTKDQISEIVSRSSATIAGSYKRLSIKTNGSNNDITVTAENFVVGSATTFKVLDIVNLTFTGLAVGANGIDAGVIDASKWYAVYVIWNEATSARAGLLSLSGSAPTLPAGFNCMGLAGWILTDAAKKPFAQNKKDRIVTWTVGGGSNVPAPRLMASGAASNVAVSTANFVSPTANSIKVSLVQVTAGAACVAPNANYGGAADNVIPPPISSYFVGGSGGAPSKNTGELLLESPNIFWTGVNEKLFCLGYEDSI